MMDNEEVLELLNTYIGFFNTCSKFAAIHYTRVFYKDDYLTGNESADFMEMIDSLENLREDNENKLNFYRGQKSAYSHCILCLCVCNHITTLNHKNCKSVVPYEYNGKEYILPIEYSEYFLEEE